MNNLSVGFCSDLHLGHELAAKKRGFNTIEEHDLSIVETLKTQCNKRTLLWILGDVAMTESSLDLLKQVPGRLKLVRGNHDNFRINTYLTYFEEIYGFLKYKSFWLSHCPIHPQEMYRCTLNVHGHIHKNSRSPELPLPYFNVNWDFHGRAISLGEIRSKLS